MDPELFKQKLSEVCEWQLVPISKEEKRSKDEELLNIEPPTRIQIQRMLPQPCKYRDQPDLYDCNITWKYYSYNRTYIRVGRCSVCSHYLTNDGQVLDPKTQNLAGTVYRLGKQK